MTTYHVTRVSAAGIYGHAEAHCDASGCNGDEFYLCCVDWWPHVRRGDILELDLSDPEGGTNSEGR
jgi:hypothetical protein